MPENGSWDLIRRLRVNVVKFARKSGISMSRSNVTFLIWIMQLCRQVLLQICAVRRLCKLSVSSSDGNVAVASNLCDCSCTVLILETNIALYFVKCYICFQNIVLEIKTIHINHNNVLIQVSMLMLFSYIFLQNTCTSGRCTSFKYS